MSELTLEALTKPRAVLFDFDGVVADSRAAHHFAWGAAVEELFGQAMGSFPQAEVEGLSSLLIAEHLAARVGQAGQGKRLYFRKLEILLSQAPLPNLFEGVRPWMQELRQLGIPCGIASNAPGEFIRMAVQRLDLSVDAVIGLGDGCLAKPEPEIYCRLAERLGIAQGDFAEVWVLEDSLTGLQAGVAAGMRTIGIAKADQQFAFAQAGAWGTRQRLTEVYQLFQALNF